jgi:hypothetical protein
MLTPTIPRLVRGRIYHIKSRGYDYLVIFKGITRHRNHYDLYVFIVIAESSLKHVVFYQEYQLSLSKTDMFTILSYIFTEVPQEDLFIYAWYELKSDLYKELLADPSINLKVKLKLKSRVAKVLRGKGAPGRNQSN